MLFYPVSNHFLFSLSLSLVREYISQSTQMCLPFGSRSLFLQRETFFYLASENVFQAFAFRKSYENVQLDVFYKKMKKTKKKY